MPAKIIDGKLISAQIKDEIKNEIIGLTEKGSLPPCLTVVIVGDDPASKVYVGNKEIACEYTGIASKTIEMPAETAEKDLLELIGKLNDDKNVNGILVQSPLPGHINEEKVLLAVAPEKDVDCFHPYNVGLVQTGGGTLLPCTPAGVIEMLKRSGIGIEGKDCAVLGRSNIVGKPMAILLLRENGTVTVCHSKTENLADICRNADILVAAIRRPRFITADMVKPGAAVIDVGIHEVGITAKGNRKLCGDVDFDGVSQVAGYITPVPGGVGSMTIAMLMRNCLEAHKSQWEI